MFGIDNKISPLPIWHYISKPLLLYMCVTPTSKADSNKILHQQCAIYWQSNYQLLIKSA